MSTRLHVHALPEQAVLLRRRCHSALQQAPVPCDDLRKSLGTAPEGEFSLVFTGQYNAGKSTLIKALTGHDDITIDANVSTGRVTEYRWGEVVLVDTPGVQSGRREHDRLADIALLNADLVVFVLTVDLFDDAGVRHLHRVATDLGKRRGLVVVVNKVGTMAADPEIRVSAVREALGPGMSVPIILTDALDELDSRSEVDPEIAAELAATGNLSGLVDALNALVSSAGQDARLRRPFESIADVCAQAQERLTEDPKEKTARKVLNRERRLVSASRRRLESQVDRRMVDWAGIMHALAEEVADRVETLDDASSDEREAGLAQIDNDLQTKALAAAETLVATLNADVEREYKLASQEIREVAQGPQVEGLATPDSVDAVPHAWPAGRPSGGAKTPPVAGDQIREVGRFAEKFAEWWGSGSATQVAGGRGHEVVYKMGKVLDHNFKPWEAVRWAKRAGNFAKAINKATPYIAIGLDAYLVVKADQDEGKTLAARQVRRRATVDAVLAFARVIDGEVRARVDQAVALFYSEAHRRIDEELERLDSYGEQRGGLTSELEAIRSECRSAVAALEVADADDPTAP